MNLFREVEKVNGLDLERTARSLEQIARQNLEAKQGGH